MDKALAILPLVLGLGVGAATPMNKEWYATLQKPPWNPPSWVFGPVWTILYLLMGFAARRIALQGGYLSLPMLLFSVQLALNLAWSPVFFGSKDPNKALTILWVLVGTVVATVVAFWKIDTVAGVMLLPYLAWLLVALSLNRWIVKKNNYSVAF
jgi:benzodiazapine receptor